jgi:hypothetical protein
LSLDPIGLPGSAVETFGVLGCPVCQAEPAIQAEAVTWFCRQAFDDPDARGRVLAAGGLCPRHWWQVAAEEESSRATMLGTAELLADILERSATGNRPIGQRPAPFAPTSKRHSGIGSICCWPISAGHVWRRRRPGGGPACRTDGS